ncbi:MAG TPA: ABC transporter permease [Gemmatimonadaceae bacterium]|nr:ABC transporter permease [Gemmatimonadaceae bacterium]
MTPRSSTPNRGSFAVRIFSLFEGVGIALEQLRANRVRAALTILGVAVGVFVVVVISAAIHGINSSVARDFEKAGPKTFFLSRFPITFEACDGTDETCKWLHNPRLTYSDAKAINALPSVEAATAQMGMSKEVRYADRVLSSTQVIGESANWTIVDHAGDLYPGRSFTEAEEANGSHVVILNDEMATRLFGESDPLDKVIKIANEPFTVIGVYHYEASFLSGGNRPRAIVPFETAMRSLQGARNNIGIAVVPRDAVTRDDAMDDVIAAMRARRGLRPAADNNFAVITQDQLLNTYNKVFGMFFLVMLVLSAIGLMVGGVGVIAIMMISVTERTREIGVRKALGATRGTILWQFLVEAVTLTGIGAVSGLIVGGLVSVIIAHATPIKASIPPMAIVAALGASAVTGVIFGMLPAMRASRLDPVDALRYE